jgi:hypothetical protein
MATDVVDDADLVVIVAQDDQTAVANVDHTTVASAWFRRRHNPTHMQIQCSVVIEEENLLSIISPCLIYASTMSAKWQILNRTNNCNCHNEM